ncbi:MAG: hypothetical protein AUI90_03160 [Deltaproteobacteria bacterium 13_1_40CM_3_69_14]|nr:MAG: hypothetical protein AUI90_03160 [Deltaproteobacteria bacterium 13_1_40CM_3_69_14]
MVLVLTACASGRKQLSRTQAKAETANVDVQHDPRFKCEMERPTGSNIPERICRYDNPDSDEHRRRTQDLLRQGSQAVAPVQTKGPGG